MGRPVKADKPSCSKRCTRCEKVTLHREYSRGVGKCSQFRCVESLHTANLARHHANKTDINGARRIGRRSGLIPMR